MDPGNLVVQSVPPHRASLPVLFEVASGDVQMNCVLIETDDESPRNDAGRLRTRSIERPRFPTD